MKKSYITATDQFCGAGGSSLGATKAGVEVRLAMNHWKLAIATHNTNFPNTDHECTDISACDPRRYPSTNILITSPECTNHTLAKGKPRRYYEKDLFGNVLIDPSEERSRATMWDVPRFAEYHDYEIVVVENVVEAGKWRLFDSWLHAMHALDYEHQVVYYNSMFAWPTPQSRDRMYTIFWKRGNKKPDLEFRPLSWCENCGGDVESIQTWKKPNQKRGKYGRQYFYRCPNCHREIKPYYYAAFNAIDWSIPGKRIGDRKKPLRPKTMARIEYGLETFGRKPMIVTTRYASGISHRIHDAVADVIPTQPGETSHGIVGPWIVETNYTGKNRAVSSLGPGPTQTARQSLGVAAPAFIANFRNTESSTGLNDPLMCITAGGNHHALLSADAFLTYYYGQTQISDTNAALGTVTTKDRIGIATNALEAMSVDDLTFRMLQAHEVGRGMAFTDDYVVLGTQKEKVKQYGNAVTPPAMEMLIARCVETLA